jgi:hypothetical protein
MPPELTTVCETPPEREMRLRFDTPEPFVMKSPFVAEAVRGAVFTFWRPKTKLLKFASERRRSIFA